MDVNQTSTTVSYGSAVAASTTDTTEDSSSDNTVITSDFETFLKMLTVQMENQDPLNPIESSDYAVQLATFSGVEQQVLTNDLLEAVQSQLGAMSMSDLAGWVGMEVRATAATHFELSPVTLAPQPVDGATSNFVVVRDANGNQVDRFETEVSSETVEWAGLDDSGTLLPEGDYSFYLQSYDATGLLAEEQIAVYSEVVEAQISNGQTMLVLASGAEVAATDVDALRLPDN